MNDAPVKRRSQAPPRFDAARWYLPDEPLLSLMLMGMVGIAWGSVDALLPTVLQQNVDNSERGAVVGVWNLSRGFGPLGQLEIGVLAATIGVAATQAINGLAFAVTVVVVTLIYRRKGRL